MFSYDSENNTITFTDSDGKTYIKYLDKSSETMNAILSLLDNLQYGSSESITSLVQSWALQGNSDTIPEDKLPASYIIGDYVTEDELNEAIENLATTSYVDEKVSEISTPSLEGYATETYVDEKVTEVEGKIPSTEGLATESYVDEKVASIEIPDTSNFTTQSIASDTGTAYIWNETSGGGARYDHVDGSRSFVGVNNGGADDIAVQVYAKNNSTNVGTRINIYNKGAYYIPNMSNTDASYQADGEQYEIAVKGDIPSLEGYATEAYVAEEVAKVASGGSIDLSSYATKEFVTESVEGLATETYVDEKISEIEHPTVDLSDYYTKEETDSIASEVEAKIPTNYTVQSIVGDNGTSYIWNESSGGGARFENNDGTTSFVGVNGYASGTPTAQIYSKDDENVTRLNVFTKGIFYHGNRSMSDAEYVMDDPDYEVAIKKDIPSIEGLATESYVDEKVGAIEIPDTSSFITTEAATTLVNAGIETVKDYTRISYIGNFENLDSVSAYLGYNDVYNATDKAIIYFSVNNTDWGIVFNNVGEAVDGVPYYTRQYMYYQGKKYRRSVQRNTSTGTVTAGSWVLDGYSTYPDKTILFSTLASLGTDASSSDISSALRAVTADELEECINAGLGLLDTTGAVIQVTKTGSTYYLTFVEDSSIQTVGIQITDGTYTITQAADTSEFIREGDSVLPYNATLAQLFTANSGTTYRTATEATILGWFGVETVDELKEKAKNVSLMSLNYVNSGDMYYRLPVHFIEFTNSNNTIHIVTNGLDGKLDTASRIEVTINMDGSNVDSEETGNVKFVKEDLVLASELTALQETITSLTERIAALEASLNG